MTESKSATDGAQGAAVSLRELSVETYRPILRLKVAESQRSLVATNAISIAQAHFEPAAWIRGIYADDTPVGFVMLDDKPDVSEYWIWRYMIGEEHQGKGYGRAALDLIVEHVRGRPNATELKLGVVEQEGSALPFYEAAGFVRTGAIEEGETIMALDLS